jgi:hypothetical protein
MTNVLCGRVEGFVGGPFDSPPMEGFHTNPLMAAVQKNTVRPLNCSHPFGASFNESVDICKIRNFQISTRKKFAESIIKANKGAIFSKDDIQDAYKLISRPGWSSRGWRNVSWTLPQFLVWP